MKRFKNILYVTETSSNQKSALDRAVLLAENNQASLTVMDVVPRLTAGIGMPDGGPISTELQAALSSEHQQALHGLCEPYRNRLTIETKVLMGTPFLEIIRSVLQDNHDLVIKTAEDPDFMSRLFGGDDMHLLRKCPCPVWLMKPAETLQYKRIVAAIDFESEQDTKQLSLNRKILELACSLALSDFAELHVVHVWEAVAESMMRSRGMGDIEGYLEAVRLAHAEGMQHFHTQLRDWVGAETYNYLSLQTHLRKGRPHDAIPLFAKEANADLMIMGTVARTGISGFFIGNTAEAILEQIHCSVLAIKPDGFISPVKPS